MTDNYTPLEKLISVTFKDRDLLKNAFVHRSYLNEHKRFYLSSNEKMEFLGDSVLSLITSVYLYKRYPLLHEGDYTEIKSSIVKTESLAEAALKLNLGTYLLLSNGEAHSGGRTNTNILADCFEALIACIFLDRNFETAYRFVGDHLFKSKLDYIVKHKLYLSAKSKLQERMQALYKTIPVYKVIQETGPEHKRTFKIAVYYKNKKLGEGIAFSKKDAEEQAAKYALRKFLAS